MTAILLHMYFLERLIISIAFLIPLVITWWVAQKYSLKGRFRPLTYILLGFSIGFLTNIAGGLLGAYIYQLPLLPLHLRQEGFSAQLIAYRLFLYSTVFKVVYIASLFVSLLLIGYGIYKLISSMS